MSLPRLLDLFCHDGGAGMGYFLAGFDVVGVDKEPMPGYPFQFVQADAVEFLGAHGLEFDVVHASPPCQAFTTMSNRWAAAQAEHPRLIAVTREAILATGKPYVLENVAGARKELREPIRLCGTSFGLPIWRHRYFEMNPRPALVPPCSHAGFPIAFGIYGKHHDGRLLWRRADGSELRAPRTLEEAQKAMEMPWADWHGIKEAVPPAMTEWIGRHLLAELRNAA